MPEALVTRVSCSWRGVMTVPSAFGGVSVIVVGQAL